MGAGLVLALYAYAKTLNSESELPGFGNQVSDSYDYNKNVIIKPIGLPVEPPETKIAQTIKRTTSIRNTKPISEETIRTYLANKKSPLVDYAKEIASSPYSGTIIGICTIEQYGCAKAPGFSPYNFWGIMGRGGLAKYGSYQEGINAIHTFLEKAESRGRDTIEELNGWYVVPASNTWYSVVTKTKSQLES